MSNTISKSSMSFDSKPLNIVFAGTPEFAAAALQALLSSHHNVVAVYTQPDRPAGRGQKLRYSPVKQLALDADIPLYQPQRLNKSECKKLRAMQADVMLVSAYGLLLPTEALTAPKLGCINIHASLLPRWRGAAPIQRAILAGDQQSGITIMQMVEALDAGPILYQASCEILAEDTGSSLHDRLAKLSAEKIVSVLEKLQMQQLVPINQDDSKATYAHKLVKQEAEIDWQDKAINIERRIRAFNAWPVAYSYLNDKRIRIWQADSTLDTSTDAPGKIVAANKNGIAVMTGEGSLNIQLLQSAGGKIVTAHDFSNAHDIVSQCFASVEDKSFSQVRA